MNFFPPHVTPFRGRFAITLASSTVLLSIAFVTLPGLIAGPVPGARGRSLADTTADAVASFWRSGHRTPAPPLIALTRYWRHYHEIKAVLAATLSVVLVLSAHHAVRAVLRRRAGRGWLTIVAAVLVVASLGSLALVAANLQGSVSPRGSLLTLVPRARPTTEGARSLALMRRALGHRSSDARTPLGVLVHDFGEYHLALAIVMGTAAAAVAVLTGLLTRRRADHAVDSRYNRNLVGAGIGLGIALCGVLVVICVANISSAAHPVHALQLLLDAH